MAGEGRRAKGAVGDGRTPSGSQGTTASFHSSEYIFAEFNCQLLWWYFCGGITCITVGIGQVLLASAISSLP